MAKRGRRAFKPTVSLRREVEQMTSCGMSQDEIARSVGISTPTLEKYFFGELETGRAKRRREVIKLLFKSARSGNVAAQKKLEDMTSVTPAPGRGGPAPASPPLGKKEQAQLDAETAERGTGWSDLVH